MNRVTAGPTPASERVEELDVLRGVALFGVFLVNMVGFTASDIIATEQQLLSLPTAALDHTLLQLIAVLFNDKANTLFAFLFGLGFHLQMQRAQARGAAFERIYVRRLTVLLCLGVLHALLLWTWDILHLYAMAGFVLLALRRLSTRSLLVGGVLLTLVSHDVGRMVFDAAGLTERFGIEATYTDEAILRRQQLSIDGNYWGLVG
ncbi:MAG TPA: heparan-alpha-glucosaminide N-acetyltransferase domain-containing protein, partial [Steroidobacteraceae bacterium]|nr:heparan-alpha-glucosaminide N-acetyltransferase domain-containing protein [Steroidobacteraceae bacterium]